MCHHSFHLFQKESPDNCFLTMLKASLHFFIFFWNKTHNQSILPKERNTYLNDFPLSLLKLHEWRPIFIPTLVSIHIRKLLSTTKKTTKIPTKIPTKATTQIRTSLVFSQLMTNFPASNVQHGLGHHLFPGTQCRDNMSFPLKCVSKSFSDFNEPDLTTGFPKSKFYNSGGG